MKNNGKSPTLKFVSGRRRDARRKFSESLGLAPPWRHALVSGSHLDPKMTGNSGSGAVTSELESLELSLGVVVPT